MSSNIESEQYLQDYLPWANSLISSEAAVKLINQAQGDRIALINSPIIFSPPPIDRLSADLILPKSTPAESPKPVKLIADFDLAMLKSVAIVPVDTNRVTLVPDSEQWPVIYGRESKDNNLLIADKQHRNYAQGLVKSTSDALFEHILHRVPIGKIPDEMLDWPIDDGELSERLRNVLTRAGIITYGDLGILSANQLLKIDGLYRRSFEEIKQELTRLGWLSEGHK